MSAVDASKRKTHTLAHSGSHTNKPLEVERVDGALEVLEQPLVVCLHGVREPRAARQHHQQPLVGGVHPVQQLHQLSEKFSFGGDTVGFECTYTR